MDVTAIRRYYLGLSEMIVWGGYVYPGYEGNGYLNTGGKYNPVTDTWIATSTTNAPTARFWHIAVWADSEMIVWGGYSDLNRDQNTGGKYNPGNDSWIATSISNAPTARSLAAAVWTGSEMIVWGGLGESTLNTGGRYDPLNDNWTITSAANAPSGRYSHTAIWTGSEMIVWGGYSYENDDSLNTGGRYNPSTDTWTPLNTTNAPSGRSSHTAVWTGSEMIVWGGANRSGLLDSGGRYDPATDTWRTIRTTGAPIGRSGHTAVFTGSEMIVWGGRMQGNLNTGGRYNPSTDSWTATSTATAPTPRENDTATWTGSEMIIWGGWDLHNYLNTGGKYCVQQPTPTPPPTGGNGSFIIGDLDAVVGRAVYFWGSQWAGHNHLSQGPAPTAFKGFANSLGGTIPNCGGVWQSSPGNSGPPSNVPSLITVIASSSVVKSGAMISGNNRKIVIVQTDPGYGPNPGHAGTGTVVSVTCD